MIELAVIFAISVATGAIGTIVPTRISLHRTRNACRRAATARVARFDEFVRHLDEGSDRP